MSSDERPVTESPTPATRRFDRALLQRFEGLALHATRRFRGGRAGERRTRDRGASTEFLDHRAYVRGDDLRHLDWNLFARHDRLYLKRHHDTQDVVVHLVVDASGSMDFGEPTKLDRVVDLAAALSLIALARGDRLVLHGLGSACPVPPRDLRGRRSWSRVLDWLASLEASGEADLGAELRGLGNRLRRPGIVVVLSDLLHPGSTDGLSYLAAGRHELHALQVLTEEEQRPDLIGALELEDAETGALMNVTATPRLMALFRQRLEEHRTTLGQALARAGSRLVEIDPNDSLEEIVLEKLQAQRVVTRSG
ncbi:MAG: DUF58 domain-containing protein [Acidobacteriota bacterium]